MNEVVSKMKKFSIPASTNVTFRELTTLGCGGTIKLTVYPDTVRKTALTVRLLRKLKVKYLVLGKGSNTLASDDEFDGVVVSTVKMKQIKIVGNNAYAEAGASTLTLSKLLQENALCGGEFLACLPASVGGATVCNAGCYGQDIASITQCVTVLRNGKVQRVPVSKCGFGKRKSIFKNNPDCVVLGVKFRLKKGDANAVAATVADMREKKAASQPLNFRSAGCVLYHDKVAVSRLIDEAGLKGYTVGDAKISTKHAGFVVNVDKARSKDIYLIIQHAKETLYRRFGICAKVEVCLVNFTKDEEDDLFAGS